MCHRDEVEGHSCFPESRLRFHQDLCVESSPNYSAHLQQLSLLDFESNSHHRIPGAHRRPVVDSASATDSFETFVGHQLCLYRLGVCH